VLPRERQTFGDNACHPERSEGSSSTDAEILRCAQDDSQDASQARSREVLSPNVYATGGYSFSSRRKTQARRKGERDENGDSTGQGP